MKDIFFLISLLVISFFSQGQDHFKAPRNKLLVVSGGGARGAWGVGFLSKLYEQNGGYRAVFGTSTGSLMAPFLLLQKNHALEEAYSNVKQKDIFSSNPFKVTYDPASQKVTTKIKGLNAVIRMILGKKTLGESKNLRNLIKQLFTMERYDSLINLYHSEGMMLAVAVTNVRTGALEIKTDTTYRAGLESDYNEMIDWIWASANEPLFMSYVYKKDPTGKDSYYVDGGLREVVPIQEGLKYAIRHDIDSVDVVINNSKIPESQNWDINAGGVMNGLIRVLNVYNMGTVNYNEKYSQLLAEIYDLTGRGEQLNYRCTGCRTIWRQSIPMNLDSLKWPCKI